MPGLTGPCAPFGAHQGLNNRRKLRKVERQEAAMPVCRTNPGTAMHGRSGQMPVSMSFPVLWGYGASKPARPRRASTGSGACFGTPLSALRSRPWWNCLTDGSERLGDPARMRSHSRSAVAPCITRIPGWFCGPAMAADGARAGPDCFPGYRSGKDRVHWWYRWF
jgi:hypothetical protein